MKEKKAFNTGKKIKIIHFVPFLSFGGAERVAAMLAHDTPKIKQKILMCYSEQTYKTDASLDSLKIENITDYLVFYKQNSIIKKARKFLILTILAFKLSRYLKEEQPDIIVTHSGVLRRVLVITQKITKFSPFAKKFPTVVNVLHSATLITKSFRESFPKAHYITPSFGTKYYYENKYPELHNKIKVIPNPIDPNIKQMSQENIKNTSIRQLLEDTDIIKLISVGSLDHRKAQWHFIRGIWYLRKKEKLPVHGFLLGGDTGMEKKLKQLVKKLKLEKFIHFLGHQSNPYKFMAKGDILWFTSLREVFPLVPLEAMYLGLPVVANDVFSGPREIFNYSKDYTSLLTNKYQITPYGILTPKMENEFLTNNPLTKTELLNIKAIMLLLNDPNLKNKIIKNALKYVNTNFSLQEIRAQYNQYYKTIL